MDKIHIPNRRQAHVYSMEDGKITATITADNEMQLAIRSQITGNTEMTRFTPDPKNKCRWVTPSGYTADLVGHQGASAVRLGNGNLLTEY